VSTPPTLSAEKKELLDLIVADLAKIPGVVAIALGGSHAEGRATPESDLDVGIYYSQNTPFDVGQIVAVAQKFAIKEPTVTDFYGWGPWVNGGAWIETRAGQVDFVYRSIEQVSKTIDDASEGRWVNDFEQQPPYGFSSVIYLAEIKSNIALHDPQSQLAKLKQRVEVYPPKLKASVIGLCLWSAEFAIWQADGFCKKADLYNAMGCFTRAVKSIVTALFALNETYPMGDKGAVEKLTTLKIKPDDLPNRVERILSAQKSSLPTNFAVLRDLHQDALKLAGPLYRSFFSLK